MAGDDLKRAVGYAAVDEFVRSGMKIGMGTGSTAVWAIRRIGEKLASGDLESIVGVATSSQAELECQEHGIPLRSLNDPEIGGALDLTIDGADEIDRSGRLTKGGGGALLVEKIVAYASARMVVVADTKKVVDQLGLSFPVPLEVLPLARVPVITALGQLGGTAVVRAAQRKMGAVISDNGNLIVDVRFSESFDPRAMETDLSTIPGVLGNGLFTRIDPIILLATESGRVERMAIG